MTTTTLGNLHYVFSSHDFAALNGIDKPKALRELAKLEKSGVVKRLGVEGSRRWRTVLFMRLG